MTAPQVFRTIALTMLLSLSALSHASLVSSTLTGVNIGGTSYDVTFTQDNSDGSNSFNDIYGVGSSPTLTFTNSGDALTAIRAVVAAATSQSFDVSPGGTGNGFALAYAYDASTFSYVTAFTGQNTTHGPFTGTSRTAALGGAFVTFTATQVPEPGSLALVIAAIAAVVTVSRRSRR